MAEPAKAEKNEIKEAGGQDKKGKKPDVIGLSLVALVTANLVILGAMGFFVKRMWGRMQQMQVQLEKGAETAPEKENELGKELTPQNVGVLYPLDSFLVNVASEQGVKYLQVQMELELTDPAIEDELSRKKAAVRDSVIVLLSSRNYRQLREPNGIKILRADLVRSINHNLTSGQIKDVFFTQFHFN